MCLLFRDIFTPSKCLCKYFRRLRCKMSKNMHNDAHKQPYSTPTTGYSTNFFHQIVGLSVRIMLFTVGASSFIYMKMLRIRHGQKPFTVITISTDFNIFRL